MFQLSQKIQEAADSLQFCRVFNNRLVKYEDMGALRMLATYSHRSNLEQVIPPAVTRLAEYDKLNNTQYLETLDSLLGNNLNLSKTAKQLFIHYKTMLHRMDRICEIAEISLDDRQTRLDVELGVKLYMMLPK
ncbi:helix-turn-helix domain-containing protein [Enterocloster bolteae]|uniref:PucR family transcriptional regulator n=1 Tax=Enterocloster bolteae TaxID=208479 RepID=UPI002A81B22C|nr:helix-turn-helix domain-containing protein [Enterocloster bolteae]